MEALVNMVSDIHKRINVAHMMLERYREAQKLCEIQGKDFKTVIESYKESIRPFNTGKNPFDAMAVFSRTKEFTESTKIQQCFYLAAAVDMCNDEDPFFKGV